MKPNILVTGCSSGIGKHCALRLREKGYHVIASARQEEDVERLKAEGFSAFQLDLNSSLSITTAVKQILDHTHGRIDALFNNGAYGQPGAVEDLSRDALRDQFETNLFGTVELTNQIIAVMRQQGYGRIVMNSSVLGLVSLKYRGAYIASKFALEGITDTYRLELTGSGVKIALIEPGPIHSQFRHNALAAFNKYIPIETSAHKDNYLAELQRLNRPSSPTERFTLGPEAVFQSLWHALESKTPKARYYVTLPTYLLAFLKRILSTRQLDTILSKASNN